MNLHLVDKHQPRAPQPSVLTADLCEQLAQLNAAVRDLRAAGFRIQSQGLGANGPDRRAHVHLGELDVLELGALRKLTDAEVLYADGRARASFLGISVLYMTPAARQRPDQPPIHPSYGCTTGWMRYPAGNTPPPPRSESLTGRPDAASTAARNP